MIKSSHFKEIKPQIFKKLLGSLLLLTIHNNFCDGKLQVSSRPIYQGLYQMMQNLKTAVAQDIKDFIKLWKTLRQQ